jgi:hypothetical protein
MNTRKLIGVIQKMCDLSDFETTILYCGSLQCENEKLQEEIKSLKGVN